MTRFRSPGGFHEDLDTQEREERSVTPLEQRREALERVRDLPGSQALSWILSRPDPRALVRGLPAPDFFWLVKKVGEEDALPILELASTEQWQYLLDLELWNRDRLDLEQLGQWMGRLERAGGLRFVRWLYREASSLAAYYFVKRTEVVLAQNPDEVMDVPQGFFTLDGLFYLKAADPRDQEALERLARLMAAADFTRYQAFLLSLPGFLPVEEEEEMYRLRNVRLAEHGFLPYEEAIAIFSPLSPETLEPKEAPSLGADAYDHELPSPPLVPLLHARGADLLAETLAWIQDPGVRERVLLELGGLCNQILAAEGVPPRDPEALAWSAQRAAATLNVALERLCGQDVGRALDIIRRHPVARLFRVGFGVGLKLQWEARRWIISSWFARQGLKAAFWGETWGGTLQGLIKRHPLHFAGGGEQEVFRAFCWLSEINEDLATLRRLMVLDGLLERLADRSPPKESLLGWPELTFHPLVFTFWARLHLGQGAGFDPLELEQAQRLLQELRETGFEQGKEGFVEEILEAATPSDAAAAQVLEEALELLWKEFVEEYGGVAPDDLSPRYSRLLLIHSEQAS